MQSFEELQKLAAQTEFFTFESPHNNYRPAPPKGFVALRSNNRRMFVKDGDPETIQKRILAGEIVTP